MTGPRSRYSAETRGSGTPAARAAPISDPVLVPTIRSNRRPKSTRAGSAPILQQQLQQARRVIAADAATVEREHPIGLGLSTVVARHDPGPSIPLRSDHTINVGQAFDPLSTGGTRSL